MTDYCPECGEPYQEKVPPHEQEEVNGEGVTLCNGDPFTYVHYTVHFV